MFHHKSRIYLHHTDAAGRLFFANQFYLIHEAKEHFLETLGLPIDVILNHPKAVLPLIHAEADFKMILKAGDIINISVGIEKVGNSSVVFVFVITKDGVLAGTAKTVNVAVDKTTNQKIPLPADLRSIFKKALVAIEQGL